MDNKSFKKEVISVCLSGLEAKHDLLMKELASLKESASSDTKSSMGDKYETGREMIMQERSKIEDQKELISRQISFIHGIDAEKEYTQAEFGAMVFVETGVYFICVPLGIMKVFDRQVFVISANSPAGQAMLDKKAGETFVLNGRNFTIQSVT